MASVAAQRLRYEDAPVAGDPLLSRVEVALRHAVARATGTSSPPRLREAIAYAVFPGGGRLRPVLCLGVADACGDARPEVAEAAAVGVELVHSASLVHDDLPCFDDAALRRGRPTVHRAYGEATALLVGDALIVMALDALARVGACEELRVLAAATGPARGVIAGQAWESENAVPLDDYHRAKTASLFEASAAMGAMSAGVDPEPWRRFGELVGRAYQAADDMADAWGAETEIGKSIGRDAALDRPSLVRTYGVDGARRRLRELVGQARDSVPSCTRSEWIHAWLNHAARRLDPGPSSGPSSSASSPSR